MDKIISFFTSQKIADLLPRNIPNRDVFLHTETFNNLIGGSINESEFAGGAEYNKETYIGHLKLKHGGMKIIRDAHDKQIGKERNVVLKHLHETLKGGNLDHNNIDLYYKALEGGFIRALICPGHNNSATCQKANYHNQKSAYKLSKHALKGGNHTVLKTFKTSAPKLYQHLKDAGDIKKLKAKRDKYKNRLTDGGSNKSDSSLSVHLSNLRNSIGTRSLSASGGTPSESDYIQNEYGGDITRAKLDEFLTEQRIARRNELKKLALANEGQVRRLSSSSNSSQNNRRLLSSSPTSRIYSNIVGGGDPLQELRMELGRL